MRLGDEEATGFREKDPNRKNPKQGNSKQKNSKQWVDQTRKLQTHLKEGGGSKEEAYTSIKNQILDIVHPELGIARITTITRSEDLPNQ